MKRVVLEWKENRCWNKGELKVFNSEGEITHTYSINNYYFVDKDFFYIYETISSSGSGSSKGELLSKIYIGDCEYEKVS